jgi:predicted RNA-binding protein YlxR (DUF448 family)
LGIISMQKKPTRMCIVCRSRESQNDLIRLQLRDKKVISFSGTGRSFYLCKTCAGDTKKTKGASRRLGVEHNELLTILKEFITYG